MDKVINMFTKKELSEVRFQEDAALSIISHLLKYKTHEFMEITMSERVIIDSVMQYVANASGTNVNDMFVRALTKNASMS